jgi:UDP-N-acetylmuramate dehydrogenase
MGSPSFNELTTMHVGGPTRDFVVAETTAELVDSVRAADTDETSVLVMGGGSNLVVGDAGWDGLTVKVATSTIDIRDNIVQADAGVEWDVLVALTLDQGLAGFEPLSKIPGSVGGTPVQNVGAFGSLTSELMQSASVYDRKTRTVEQWPASRCGFGSHRQSVFKHTDRYVILSVTYELQRSTQSKPLVFDSLLKRLDLTPGGTAPTADVRQAVIEARREKGSVYDPDDHDTWGTGSFFINPVVSEVPTPASEAGVPTYPDVRGTKLPAAWLIHQAGFAPGYGSDWGRGSVTLSSKHALAVSNRGDATTAEVMAFAAHIRAGVEARFGIRLGPECDLVNCSLDDASGIGASYEGRESLA